MRGLVALLLLFLAAPAEAASVRVQDDCDRYGCQAEVWFAAAAGEANRVVMSGDGRSVAVADLGAPVAPGRGCSAPDPRRVVCTSDYPLARLVVDLGDGDDRADTDGFTYGGAAIEGGSGDDRLRTGAGEDEMDGGPGDDVLDGGRGPDRVDYSGARAAVRADLAAGRVRVGPGEVDSVRAVSVVVGGRGDDVLLGDDGGNGLVGGPGDDRLEGRGGDDGLAGGDGDDRLSGGPGDDHLNSLPLYAQQPYGGSPPTGEVGQDRIRCGEGADHVETPGRRDVLAPGCERVQVAGGPLHTVALRPLTSLAAPVAGVGVFCGFRGVRFWVEVRAVRDGRLLGRAASRCKSATLEVHRVFARLNGYGRRVLRALPRGRRLRVRVTAAQHEARGSVLTELVSP